MERLKEAQGRGIRWPGRLEITWAVRAGVWLGGLCNRGQIMVLHEMGLGLFQRQKIRDLDEKLLSFYS